MSIRSIVGTGLRNTLGRPRTEQLRRKEAGVRADLARWIAPGSTTPATPASPATGAATKPATRPAAKAKSAAAEPLTREQTIEALGRSGKEGMGAGEQPPAGLKWVAADPFEHTGSGFHKHHLLERMHEQLQPRRYFEIGVDEGQSLTLSRARTVAVDPAYRITRSIHCDVQTFLATSDDFFADEHGFDHFDGLPADLAFIDGMHLAEFVLRDFINTEKRMSPGGVVILDDMLPRNSLEAQRVRRTSAWAGDVYKVHEVLRTHRPDLTILPVNTEPTGSYLVLGLDPTSTVLDEVYEQVLPELDRADPQTVDPAWLQRRDACDPHAVTASALWDDLRTLRDRDAAREEYADLWSRLNALGRPATAHP